MPQIEIAQFPKRIFYINTPARFTHREDITIPERKLAVIVFPQDAPNAPPITPNLGYRNGEQIPPHNVEWCGWFPSCKPWMETPWDGITWGKAPNPIPENFYPYAPVQFGKAFPLGNNELFPIIKKVRAEYGRDFHGFVILFNAETTTDGKINYSGSESYTLVGDFPGFKNSEVADI